MKYARGKDAWAIDDRTGHRVRLRDLRTEWNGLRVHKDEWEAKHPQLRPRSVEDAIALKGARPGDSGVNHSTVIMRRGVVASFYQGAASAQSHATPAGLASTTAINLGTPNAFAFATGVAITSALGTVKTGAGVAGVAITSALGAESLSISANVAETGVSTTVALGNEVPMSMDLSAGVAGTFAVGSVTVNCWGAGAWDTGTWGN